MEPVIVSLTEKKLVGKNMTMSLSVNKTFTLWQSFMPKRKEIKNRIESDLISMRIYNEPIRLGDLNQTFQKWAAVEVSNFNNIAEGMNSYSLPGGLYAVFHYKGLNTNSEIFKYIFGTWLPDSGYVLDDRPHFEILGKKYKNGDPDSEEDIYIPVKMK